MAFLFSYLQGQSRGCLAEIHVAVRVSASIDIPLKKIARVAAGGDLFARESPDSRKSENQYCRNQGSGGLGPPEPVAGLRARLPPRWSQYFTAVW